jgi:hypothetical protein
MNRQYRHWMAPAGIAALIVMALAVPASRSSQAPSPDDTHSLSESIEAIHMTDLEPCMHQRSDQATLCRAAAGWRRVDAYRHEASRLGCQLRGSNQANATLCGQLLARR